MDLDVVFVGTSGSVPTPSRGLASVLVRRGGQRVLVDCGEGTQRQLMRSCGLGEIDVVALTHAHGDHVLGLPGMLKTWGLRDRVAPLKIVAPRSVLALLTTMQPAIGTLPYDIDYVQIIDGFVVDLGDWCMTAFATEHRTPSVGYRFDEDDRPGTFDVAAARALGVPEGPAWGQLQRGQAVEAEDGTTVTPEQVLGELRYGRRIMITGDTRACASVREAARDADLLVHEATFGLDEVDRAKKTAHSTAHDAALTAVAADVQMLAITHLSNRYHGRELAAEAQAVFPGAVCPRDFDLIEIPFRERGVPKLMPRGARDRPPREAAASGAAPAGPATPA